MDRAPLIDMWIARDEIVIVLASWSLDRECQWTSRLPRAGCAPSAKALCAQRLAGAVDRPWDHGWLAAAARVLTDAVAQPRAQGDAEPELRAPRQRRGDLEQRPNRLSLHEPSDLCRLYLVAASLCGMDVRRSRAAPPANRRTSIGKARTACWLCPRAQGCCRWRRGRSCGISKRLKFSPKEGGTFNVANYDHGSTDGGTYAHTNA
jgi:hypothetical protein